jgi:hypothetical protein
MLGGAEYSMNVNDTEAGSAAVFLATADIVRAIEAHLIGEKESDWRVIAYLQRIVWFPWKFLQIGIREKLAGTKVWAFLAAVLIFAANWITTKVNLVGTEFGNLLIIVCAFAALMAVVFAMPSTYAHSGITERTVGFVTTYLEEHGFGQAKRIEFLRKTIKPFEERAKARVTALKWLVGSMWAASTYLFAKGAETMGAAAAQALSAELFVAVFICCTFGAYLLVWGYEASLDALFRAIEFGCNDLCHAIDVREADLSAGKDS